MESEHPFKKEEMKDFAELQELLEKSFRNVRVIGFKEKPHLQANEPSRWPTTEIQDRRRQVVISRNIYALIKNNQLTSPSPNPHGSGPHSSFYKEIQWDRATHQVIAFRR